MNKIFAITLLATALIVVLTSNTPALKQASASPEKIISYHPSPCDDAPIVTPAPERVVPLVITASPKKVVRIETMRVTAYCPCKICCGRKACGIAADGTRVKGKMLIAADWGVVAKGTMLNVPGYGTAKVRDTGSAIKGNRLDVYFDSHEVAKKWGVKYLQVEVLK